MSDRATRGKRRADPPKRRRARNQKTAGRRADRPENHEGITPEFLRELRELDDDPTSSLSDFGLRMGPGRGGPGPREILAGIDADLRADEVYQHALSRLAYGG